jgi:ketosteroid isomerase-like protein
VADAWSEGLASVTEKFQTVRSAAKDDLDDLFHDDEEAAK